MTLILLARSLDLISVRQPSPRADNAAFSVGRREWSLNLSEVYSAPERLSMQNIWSDRGATYPEPLSSSPVASRSKRQVELQATRSPARLGPAWAPPITCNHQSRLQDHHTIFKQSVPVQN